LPLGHESNEKNQKVDIRYDKLSGEVKLELDKNVNTRNEMSNGQNLGESLTLRADTKEPERRNNNSAMDKLSGEVKAGKHTNMETGNDLKDMDNTGQKSGASFSQETNDNRGKEEIPNEKLSGEQSTGPSNNVAIKKNLKGKDIS
jgi:hypothetical protein